MLLLNCIDVSSSSLQKKFATLDGCALEYISSLKDLYSFSKKQPPGRVLQNICFENPFIIHGEAAVMAFFFVKLQA